MLKAPMCGIAGTYRRPGRPADAQLLLSMAGELHHRGPDGVGLYLDGRLGMTATRLAIVDLEGGDQPLSDERGRIWVMQNGEIYNHVELRADLEGRGHTFASSSDTEVIAHAYEEWGIDCLRRFNGDFAIAIWDRAAERLVLARDRFGVRPLFLAEQDGDVCFASEARALLRHPSARRELDPAGIVDSFVTWSALPGRSAFAGIRELPPAHYVVVDRDGIGEPVRWWELVFDPAPAAEAEVVEELEATLDDAIRLRLRADVEVATYLSGGLDSSLIAALAARRVGAGRLAAFGVGFTDEHFDESAAQDAIGAAIGVDFHRTVASPAAIAEAFGRSVELAERPLLRTAPAPLLLLSAAVREAGLKVVLTGEGADELFAGYDLFREDKLRRFWARDPESRLRPLLFARLNRWLATDPARAGAFLHRFYARDLTAVDDPLYSHRLRFANTSRALSVLDPALVAAARDQPSAPELIVERLPPSFAASSPLARAQQVEIATFFQGYLLHAQGDRVLMGNSIEGRFPYVDHRVAELAARIPDSLRLRGLREKHALREVAARCLPPAIGARPKVPYRAPIRSVFCGNAAGEALLELVTGDAGAGLLAPRVAAALVAKARAADATMSETDEMALAGAVSLALLHERLVASPTLAAPAEPSRVVVGDRVVEPALAAAGA
jgi:asparagine synthase (glutamine-hydrolysing)